MANILNLQGQETPEGDKKGGKKSNISLRWCFDSSLSLAICAER